MHSRLFSFLLIMTVAAVLGSSPGLAEEIHTEHAESAGEAEHHGDEGHNFKNAAALFLGATNESGHSTEGTWGLEYGCRVAPQWVVGGLIDFAGGDQRNPVIAPMVMRKPIGGLVVLAAPGVEVHNGRGQVEHHLPKADAAAVDEDETYFVFRLGAAHYFRVGSRDGIGPAINLAFVDGHEVWVYGVNFEVMS